MVHCIWWNLRKIFRRMHPFSHKQKKNISPCAPQLAFLSSTWRFPKAGMGSLSMELLSSSSSDNLSNNETGQSHKKNSSTTRQPALPVVIFNYISILFVAIISIAIVNIIRITPIICIVAPIDVWYDSLSNIHSVLIWNLFQLLDSNA